MSYDPEQRRDTPLALQLKQRIAGEGPISITHYMRACLQDETHGYYRTREGVGAAGDFITAPEVSQVFGELIGLWSAVVWQQMGAPEKINLIELGPGRGTLIADALRAARILPNFIQAISLHLVESSKPAREAQRSVLQDCAVTPSWHGSIADVPPGPTIIIGNEFLDVLPVEQFVKRDGQWRRRAVAVDGNERLVFSDVALNADAQTFDQTGAADNAANGAIMEACDFGALLQSLIERAAAAPLAALFLDYGHESTQIGETLQGVRAHQYEHPLCSPGEADLTCHVNFRDLAHQTAAASDLAGIELAIDGPGAQANFLGALGIIERASILMDANPQDATEIETAIARLLAPQGMGTRFKAIGLRSAKLPPLPGFSSPDAAPDTAPTVAAEVPTGSNRQ